MSLHPTARAPLRRARTSRNPALRTPALQAARDEMARILRDQRRCEYIGPRGARANKLELANLLNLVELERLEVAHA